MKTIVVEDSQTTQKHSLRESPEAATLNRSYALLRKDLETLRSSTELVLHTCASGYHPLMAHPAYLIPNMHCGGYGH